MLPIAIPHGGYRADASVGVGSYCRRTLPERTGQVQTRTGPVPGPARLVFTPRDAGLTDVCSGHGDVSRAQDRAAPFSSAVADAAVTSPTPPTCPAAPLLRARRSQSRGHGPATRARPPGGSPRAPARACSTSPRDWQAHRGAPRPRPRRRRGRTLRRDARRAGRHSRGHRPARYRGRPLPDGDRDGVVVAQAWHWFDPRRPCPRSRAAAPGRPPRRRGTRDHRVDRVDAFTEIIHRGDSLEPTTARLSSTSASAARARRLRVAPLPRAGRAAYRRLAQPPARAPARAPRGAARRGRRAVATHPELKGARRRAALPRDVLAR